MIRLYYVSNVFMVINLTLKLFSFFFFIFFYKHTFFIKLKFFPLKIKKNAINFFCEISKNHQKRKIFLIKHAITYIKIS